jgi:hypothetical protein
MQRGVESLGAHGGSDRGDAPAFDALDVDQLVLGDRRESAHVPPRMLTLSGRPPSEFSAVIHVARQQPVRPGDQRVRAD